MIKIASPLYVQYSTVSRYRNSFGGYLYLLMHNTNKQIKEIHRA